MNVEVDTAAHGTYQLLLAQADGKTHEVPLTILPPAPRISNLPVRVNCGREPRSNPAGGQRAGAD